MALRSYATPHGRLSFRFRRVGTVTPPIAALTINSQIDVMCTGARCQLLLSESYSGSLVLIARSRRLASCHRSSISASVA